MNLLPKTNALYMVSLSFVPDSIYFVDAMSSFGAIPVSMEESQIDYLVSSANKCIQGVPGFSYVICNKKHLSTCKGM